MSRESSDGLSKEEFLVLQEQLIDLKNQNYELREALKKKNSEVAFLSSHSPRNEALQFASKLMNRGKDKDKELAQKYETEINSLRQKLATQEEEFRLQQETLICELNKVITQSESVQMELDIFKSQASSYASPQAEKLSSEQKTADKIRIDLQEKNLFLHAIEDQLLDYKQRLGKAEAKLSLTSKDMMHLSNSLEESQLKVTILVEDLRKYKELVTEKENIISDLRSNIETMKSEPHAENQNQCELSADIMRLKEENINLSKELSISSDELIKFRDDNKLLSKLVADKDQDLENFKMKLLKIEENQNRELTEWTKKMTVLEECIQFSDESHRRELEEEKKRNEQENNEVIIMEIKIFILYIYIILQLIEKISNLEARGNKEIEDRALLLETRYQLELSDREKNFDTEREVMRKKIHVLEVSLAAKDEERVLALKKQAALIKELQRAVKEERKRADSLEKGRDDKGWHVVAEVDARSNHTLDGNESVSSASALESDNAELINRLTALQKTHAETMDKV
uniref:GRIP domain-containing protein n=1 Tax=Heterorhabditis bacteriophora TaxID=37862 RepID=A0A1I7XSI8_HETBA